ncbi:glycosyltransferase family 2 protein [Azospirillum thiophilum]|uniref:glycosyltransferase family 2 protein n=1 Tax=Azospirillum thiophilum TaxID=528244 RepID=UPI000697FA6A|nr:glycosyltransferase family A protein [Azospirillum thiophilum]
MIREAVLFLRQHVRNQNRPLPERDALVRGLFDAALCPASTESRSRDAGDVAVPPTIRHALLSALPLTDGAREAGQAQDGLHAMVSVVFADKLFRGALREDAARNGLLKDANRTILAAGNLGEALASPDPSFRVSPGGLAGWWDRMLSVKGRHGTYLCRIGDLAKGLQAGDNPGKSREMMRALGKSDFRLVLVLLHRACERGDWTVAGPLRPYLMIEAARVLASLNANRSAFAIGTRILDDAAYLEVVAETDRLELMGLTARWALRSGNQAVGTRLCRDAFHEVPTRGDLLVRYLSAVFDSDRQTALTLAGVALFNNPLMDKNEALMVAEFLRADGRPVEATAMFSRAAGLSGLQGEHLPGFANLALDRGDREGWFSLLRMYGAMHGLEIDSHDRSIIPAPFAFHRAARDRSGEFPKVSVMMSCFNSAATVERAAGSVLAQDIGDLELIIIDDASTDGSQAVIARLARRDPRVTVILNDANRGTYASKNRGIEQAKGAFLAFHDSDDWMHPAHLRRQLDAMDDRVACSTSNWLRMTGDGHIVFRRGGGYGHLNPASTLFRRELVEAVGLFEEVRTGADSEFLTRIRMRYGWGAVRSLPDCLAIGLHHENSLTQSGSAAFDEHRYSPVRLDYTEAWVERALLGAESCYNQSNLL